MLALAMKDPMLICPMNPERSHLWASTVVYPRFPTSRKIACYAFPLSLTSHTLIKFWFQNIWLSLCRMKVYYPPLPVLVLSFEP